MTAQLLSALSQYGLIVVGLNVLLNQIGLPLPAVPTLIVAGAAVAGGQMSLSGVFSIAVAACLIADCGWFYIGQRYGIRVLRLLCRISLEPDSCVSQTQNRFEHWGVNSIVIAKFVPGLSIIAPPLAGAMRIGWLRFILLSMVAAVLWVGAGIARRHVVPDPDCGPTGGSEPHRRLPCIGIERGPGRVPRVQMVATAYASTSCCAWHVSPYPNCTT